MVESDDGLCVVGTAETGLEGLAKIGTLYPDVVTLDIDMPGLDGIETLKRIMEESPLPVIIVSSLARKGAEATLEALRLGAFDCIAKQLTYATEDVITVQEELVAKIKAAAGPRFHRRASSAASLSSSSSSPSPAGKRPPRGAQKSGFRPATKPAVITIAASTGGPTALEGLLRALPLDLPVGILVVQHMPVGFIGALAERLNSVCRLRVREAKDRDLIKAGHVYIAPAGKHMIVRRRTASEVYVHLPLTPTKDLHVPSADVMMSSVADVFRAAAMGIVLTGMGNDGAAGMRAIFREGGLTLGQDQESCVVYGMPRACAESGVLHQVVPLSDIPLHILAALHYQKGRGRGTASGR